MKWRVIDSGFNDGKTNMQIDLQLAESCKSDEAFLRFYRWRPYCISLGANQKIEEINLFKLNEDKLDFVFRPTGGRAILHAEELTYSVIYPLIDQLSFRNLYHNINLALIKGLSNYDVILSSLEMENVQPNFREKYNEPIGTLCFAFPAKSEIKFNGKKLVGSAQKKLRNSVLQHGSILCGNGHLKIINYLNISDSLRITLKEDLKNKTTDLFAITNQPIDYQLLILSIANGFKEYFAFDYLNQYSEIN